MPARHDGGVIIDTELDTAGVERDSAELKKRITSLNSTVDKFGEHLQKITAGYSSTVSEIMSIPFESTVEGMTDKLKMLGEVEIPTDQYKKICEDLEKTDAQFQKLIDRQEKMSALGVSENTAQWKSLQYDIEQASERYRQLEAAKAAAESSGTAFTVAAETSEYEKLSTALEQVSQTHTSAFRRMIDNLRKYVRESKKTALQNNKLIRSLTSLKTLLIARVKRMFISSIFGEVQTQLSSLRKYYGAYNTAMNRINGATSRAGASVAIAIAHLVVTAEPFIVRLINLLTNAIDKINKFISLLTGVKYISSGGLADYTQALQNTAEAQEKLNADLYSYDQLTRQSENVGTPTPTSGGSGGGSGTGASWTEEPKETNGWVEKLKGNMGSLLTTALGIGSAIAAWGIGNKILKLMGKNSAAAKLKLAGFALAVGGVVVYARNLIDALKNGLSNSNVDGMFGSAAVAAAGLGVALKSLTAGGITLAVGGIGMLIAGAKDWIKTGELTNESFKSIELGIAALGAGLVLAVPGIGKPIAAIVALVAAGALAIYKNWDSIKAGIVDAYWKVSEWWEGTVVAGMSSAYDKAIAWFGNLGNSIRDKLVNAYWTVSEWWEGTVQVGIETAIDWIVNAWNTCGNWIAEAGEAIKTALINGYWAASDWWEGTAVPGIGMAIDWVVQAFVDIGTELSILWQQTLFLAQDIVGGIRDFFILAVDTIRTNAQIAAAAVKQHWADLKANTIATFTAIKAKITSDIQAAKANMIAAVTSAKASVVAQWNALQASCKAIFQGIHTTIITLVQQASSFLAGQSWYGYGVNLMQGFWNGLRSLMSAVWSSVVDFVRRCAEAVRSALRIGSPSKVFAEIGRFTGEGFIVGLEDQQEAAIKTASNLAEAVTDSMGDGVGNLDVTADGIETVIVSLVHVAGIFKTIASTLSSIGGLTQPQISAGTVVPPKTRVNSSDSSEDDSEAVATLLMEILAVLRGLGRPDGGDNGERHYHIHANGREIFDLVVDENNQAINRTGESPLRV